MSASSLISNKVQLPHASSLLPTQALKKSNHHRKPDVASNLVHTHTTQVHRQHIPPSQTDRRNQRQKPWSSPAQLQILSGMSLPVAQLSCQNCTRRKTKCDKKLPSCSTCVKTGVTCTIVQRQRLPRGRSARLAKSSSEQVLRDRVDQLESIVSRLQQTQPPLAENNVSTPVLQRQTLCPH